MKHRDQDGPSEERIYSGGWLPYGIQPTDEERDTAIALLCEHLGVEVWRTNKTKHGNVEIELRKIES